MPVERAEPPRCNPFTAEYAGALEDDGAVAVVVLVGDDAGARFR
jgi:hypothetical protein